MIPTVKIFCADLNNIASITGTFVYRDDTSKLTTSSSSVNSTVFIALLILLEDELILHCGTTDNHSATFRATLW